MRNAQLVSLPQFGEKIRLKKLLSLLVASPLLVLNMACQQMDEAQVKPGAEITTSSARTASGMIGVNVLLNQPVSDKILAELGTYGNVRDVLREIKALTMQTTREQLTAIQKLPYVSVANQDAERQGGPVDAVSVTDFGNGANTWNLDAVNVTDAGVQGRTVDQDATGVYVGVLDTGLLDSWRQYFPEQRIATQFAKSFGGGGGEVGNVSEQPNKWEHDQDSHGTHVTSTIIGFNLGGASINGVAPQATTVPVKVLNQNGSGWSSVIARGIMYMAQLKEGPLKDSPVVINMSLGGSVLDAIEKAALDYAISKGVLIVASAGNSGAGGMGYPGAYAPVISVASAGLKKEFSIPRWWSAINVPDPTNPDDFYIADYSSLQKEGQQLDVTAPGSNVVGPYQVNGGQLGYYYLSGTSMASPHVAGIVALMAQKNPGLTQTGAEAALKAAAIRMATIEQAGAGFITADAALNGKRTAMR